MNPRTTDRLIIVGLILLIIGGFVVGCTQKPSETTEKGAPIYQCQTTVPDGMGSDIVGYLFRTKFDGHIYILRNNGLEGGICHDPDCPCTKKVTLEKEEALPVCEHNLFYINDLNGVKNFKCVKCGKIFTMMGK